MPNFFIDRPIFAWVVALFIILFGVLALPNLPIAQYPEVAPPSIEVTATYPGASAEQLDESVTSLVEQELNGAEGMIYYASTSSSSGRATISATFEPGTNPQLAQVEVQNRIRRVESRLPQQVLQQGLQVERANAGFLMVGSMLSDNPEIDRIALGDYATRNVINEIRRVPGVGQAQLFAPERALRVWIDPAKLTGLDLLPSDVFNAISAQNAQVSAGTIGDRPSTPTQQITATVTVRGQLSTPEEFGNIILRANPDGSTVRLRDVARVEVGAQTYQFMSYQNGVEAAAFGVQLAPGANALATSEGVRAKLEELSEYFPQGVRYDVPYDTAPFIEISIEKVIHTLVEAIVLVFLVMFLFLQNIRYTLIPTIVVPIALLGTLAVLYALGFSVNVLTMFGMVLAIGILVDDAIIVVENTERIMAEEGLTPREAVRKAMRQITAAIVGITLVLIAVFLPLAFMSGSVGVIYRQFSASMAISIAFSGFLALSLTPALCATLLKPISHGGEHQREVRRGPLGWMDRFFNWFNRFFDRSTHRYEGGVRHVIGRPKRYMLVFLAIVALMAVLFLRLPSSFLPVEDQGSLLVDIQLPPNAAANRTREASRQIENYYMGDPATRQRVAEAYASGDEDRIDEATEGLTPTQQAVEKMVMINGFSFSGTGPNAGLSFVILRDWAERDDEQSAQAIADRAIGELFAMSGIKDGTVFSVVPPAIQGLGTSSGFEFRLQDRAGLGHAALQAASQELMNKARQGGMIDPQSLRVASLPDAAQIQVEIDRQKASALGVSFADINQTLSISIGSTIVNDFPNQGRMQRVMIQADTGWRMAPEDILRLYVRNAQGEMVPMSAFATIDWVYGPVMVSRYNGYPSVNISGEGAAGVSSGAAMEEMARLADELPPGFGFEWTGQSLQEQQSGAQAPMLLGLSILVVFLVLAALYESWSIPLSVILVVPLGVLGAVLAVTLVGMPNDVFFKVGLITIIGLSAKNAILIIEFAKDLHAEGKDLLESTLEAARLRFRPILMTSLAFGFGVVPLALATGASSASQRAVGVGVLGGIVAATVLAVFLVPVFFVFVSNLFKPKPRYHDRYPTSFEPGRDHDAPAQEH
ncbi:efflux RND transporter permease subunit [Coralloluteibacterium stylophorae]|uniref:Efflux RND transporter permease subunit n=1 Tax=Coralloluteibacterium stylophorae TaxID=1776034 RepID=A0A8J8B0A8_9GAMM|nr:efflux RND transporter permease subunit [Coralloluteibacterium stylophorae]MBS7457565.1 efflux RND transporter permease subunit [Coralloluteibacterium stylophorae]